MHGQSQLGNAHGRAGLAHVTRLGRGVPATVVSTSSYNAPQRFDPATATLGDELGDDVRVARRSNGTIMTAVEDVNRDGLSDLTLYFPRDQLARGGDLTTLTTQLTLRAAERGGCTWVEGRSAVQVVR